MIFYTKFIQICAQLKYYLMLVNYCLRGLNYYGKYTDDFFPILKVIYMPIFIKNTCVHVCVIYNSAMCNQYLFVCVGASISMRMHILNYVHMNVCVHKITVFILLQRIYFLNKYFYLNTNTICIQKYKCINGCGYRKFTT